MRRTKEEAEQTRIKLLNAAMQLIAEKGIEALRLSDIAARIGMTRGAVYWHFGNKDDLITALFKERIDPFFNIIDHVIEEPISAIQKLEKLLIVFIEKLKKDQDFFHSQRLYNLEYWMSLNYKEIHTYFNNHREKYFNCFIQLMQEGIDEGDIRPLDPRALSSVLAAFIAGYGHMFGKHQMNDLYIKDPKLLADIFLNGIRKDK